MCPAWGTKRIYASFFVVSIFAINHRRIDIECNKRFHNSIINHGLSHNAHLQANELKFVQSAQFFSTWLVYYDELNPIVQFMVYDTLCIENIYQRQRHSIAFDFVHISFLLKP